jgi:hypothetical protein
MAPGRMNPPDPGLADLQRHFQAWLTAIPGAVAPAVTGPDRRQVYADAYQSRLLEALGHDFPALRVELGPDAFAAIGRDYIAAHPSTVRSIRWFGAALPAFLRTAHPSPDGRAWADLAAFEWTLGEAFDAPGATVLGDEDLRSLDPGAWTGLGFGFHPTVRRLDTATDAVGRWQRCLGLTPGGPGPSGGPYHWLVWRRDLAVLFRAAGPDEAAAVDGLLAGQTLTMAAAGLAERAGAEQGPGLLAAWLRQWLQEGLLTRAILADPGAGQAPPITTGANS